MTEPHNGLSAATEGVVWRRVSQEPFEHAIQQGPHGDEFVKLLNGTCLRRPIRDDAQPVQVTDALVEAGAIGLMQDVAEHDQGPSFHDASEQSRSEAKAMSRACLTAALAAQPPASRPEMTPLQKRMNSGGPFGGENIGQPSPAATVETKAYSDAYTQENIEILESEVRRLRNENSQLAAAITAQPPAAHPSLSADRETVAKIIYDAFPFEPRHGMAHKPEWVPGGNSTRQDEARRTADLIRAVPQSSGVWQPIATVPKDGTKILLRFAPPFYDTTENGVTTGCMTTAGSWWLSCIWASTSAHRDPIEWAPIPSLTLTRPQLGSTPSAPDASTPAQRPHE